MHFWREQGENHLKKILATSLGPKTDVLAKNIIVFIGDGMGMTTITAGRIYKGQTNGGSGEEASLVFDDFPHTGLAKVSSSICSVNRRKKFKLSVYNF